MALPATLYPSQLNSVSTTLNGSLAQASTTVQVTTVGNLLPNSSCPYLVMIGPSTGFDSTTEICICTGVSGSVLTITRAQGGSTAPTSWASGSLIACNFSSLHWTNLVTDMNYLAAMPWTALGTPTYTTGSSTFTLVGDQHLLLPAGTALKYVDNSNTYFGAVVSATYSSVTTVVIMGPPIDASLTAVSYGNGSLIDQMTIPMPGYYDTQADGNYINDRLLIPNGILWNLPKAYIIGYKFNNGASDGGGSQPILNLLAGTWASGTTSTTSITIGTGAKTFTTASSGQYAAGQLVVIYNTASPAYAMIGTVTSCTTTSLVMSISATNGTGTYASWTISAAGLYPVSTSNSSAGVTNSGTSVVGTTIDVTVLSSTNIAISPGQSLEISVMPGASSPSNNAQNGQITMLYVIP